MKRFICRSLLFLLPVLAVLAGWEVLMRNFPHVFRYKKTVILEKCRKEGEIVFLGSSHAFFGIDTDLLPHAWNLAFASQQYHHDRFIFELLVKGPNRLKYVAVPVSVFSFFRPETNVEEWRERDYVRYWGYPAKKFSDRFFVLENIPLQFSYVRKTSGNIRKKGLCRALHISPTGWGTSYREAGDYGEFEKLGAIAARRHSLVDMNDTGEFEALKSLIALARRHGIKVILYTPPGHRSYYTRLDPRQLKKMYAMIADLIAERGVFYLDLLRSDAFGPEDFHDPDHLSSRGARKLALMLRDFYKDK